MKNLVIFIFIAILVAIGIMYSVFSDPELESKRIFEQAISEFAKNAGGLETQYKKDAALPVSSKILRLDGVDNQNDASGADPSIKMQVFAQYVVLTFSEGEWDVANQTVVLEPFLKAKQLRWKCINGSLLVRLRSKDCRLGNGILISEW